MDTALRRRLIGPLMMFAILVLAFLPGFLAACSPAAGGDEWFLGTVEDGRFQPLVPSVAHGGFVRLTTIPMQAAQAPESGEPDLAQYEGRAVIVRGHDGGGWIYSARVVAKVGPILSFVIRRVLGQGGRVR